MDAEADVKIGFFRFEFRVFSFSFEIENSATVSFMKNYDKHSELTPEGRMFIFLNTMPKP